MKAKINGYEVECTVEEFKQLTKKNEINSEVTAVKWSPEKRKYRKISKKRAPRIKWTKSNVAKMKRLDAKYAKLNMPINKRNFNIGLELGASELAVSRQRTIQKMTKQNRG